jgi:hypothetical protein
MSVSLNGLINAPRGDTLKRVTGMVDDAITDALRIREREADRFATSKLMITVSIIDDPNAADVAWVRNKQLTAEEQAAVDEADLA